MEGLEDYGSFWGLRLLAWLLGSGRSKDQGFRGLGLRGLGLRELPVNGHTLNAESWIKTTLNPEPLWPLNPRAWASELVLFRDFEGFRV